MRVPLQRHTRTTPSAQPLQPRSAAGATPEAFGAGVGAALTGLAAQTQALGNFVQEQQTQKARFDTSRRLSAFQTEVQRTMAEAKRAADPAQANFADQATAIYRNLEADFINNQVPDELKDEFSARTAQIGEAVVNDALKFQYESTDLYFRRAIEDEYEAARTELDQGASFEMLEAQRARLDELLDSTALSEAEKVAMRRQIYVGLESVAYKSLVRAGKIESGALGVGAGGRGGSLTLLREFTGLPDEALEETALAAEQSAVRQIGSLDAWAAMPDRAQAALISVVADVGELPEPVLRAIAGGDLTDVAAAIRAMGGERRAIEADTMLGEVELPAEQLDADERFSNIPYEDRLALRADADREAAAILTAQTQAETARNKALVNALHTAIFDGQAGQADIDNAREQGWLVDIDDISKAAKMLEKRDEDLRLAQLGQQILAGGRTMDPSNSDHRDMLNAMVGRKGIEALDSLDAEYAATTLIPMVRTAQDIPTDVAGLLQGMIRNNDTAKAQWGLDLMTQLEQASPAAYAARFNEADRRDVYFWQARKDYYPEEVLMPMVRGGLTQAERAATEQLRAEGSRILQNKDLNVMGTLLNEIVPWGYSHAGIRHNIPWAARALEMDFQELFIDEYARDGDIARAKAAAVKTLKSVWAVSEIGGQATLMKYPPERVGYPPINGSFDWIEQQVRTELAIPENEAFELIADEQTRQEVEDFRRGGEPPSYLVVRTDANGVSRIAMTDEGVPVREYFEITEEMRAEQELEWEGKRQQLLEYDSHNLFGQAYEHSLETGEPIPQELMDQYDQQNPWNTLTGTVPEGMR